MNLPIRLLLTAGLATLLFTAFTKKTLPTETPKPAAATASPKTLYLYWYTYPYDMFNDWKSIADEEYELWVMYGFPVDMTPGGGTLLMRGYYNDTYPHNQLPYVLLYGHFPFMVDGPGRPAK